MRHNSLVALVLLRDVMFVSMLRDHLDCFNASIDFY
jgi:hypothetical protein